MNFVCSSMLVIKVRPKKKRTFKLQTARRNHIQIWTIKKNRLSEGKKEKKILMNFIILEGPVTFVFDVKKRVRKMINELKATLVISTFASDVFKKKKKDEMKRNVGKKKKTHEKI